MEAQTIAPDFAASTSPVPLPVNVKFQPTPQGMACAYLSIMVMALIPIFYGSFKSIKHQIDTVAKCKETGEQAETMTGRDALIFPFFASGALLGFYILMKFFPDPVNLLLSGYFFILGVLAIIRIIKTTVFKLFPTKYNRTLYTLKFESRQLDEQSNDNDETSSTNSSEISNVSNFIKRHVSDEVFIDCNFYTSDIFASLISLGLGAWYLTTKHWVSNNIFGLAFALNGIELLNLNSFKIGCILLCGLFIYDIFWVFGTNVMVSVAKSFDAPIKLVFPQDFLVHGFWGKNFAMLGLGDIVIPGVFIALLLRFDHSMKSKKNIYFWSCFSAYIAGLGLTIGVMSYYKHAQPALLYLVPCCIITPLTVAILRGDLGALFAYRDHPEEEDAETEGSISDENDQPDKSAIKRKTRSSTKKDN